MKNLYNQIINCSLTYMMYIMMVIHMLFKKAGKIKGKFILPLMLLMIFAGCSLFNFGLKLNTTPLDIPPNAGFIMSPSSGYITVIDTKEDSVVGRQEVAIRRGGKLENICDFLIHNGLIYVTLHDRQAFEKGSDVLRILDPSSGKVEESKVGWAPNGIFHIGENLAFVSTNLIYYSNRNCYNYIYNLNTRKVVDTIAFEDALVDFAVYYGDTIIMDVKYTKADSFSEYFVLYSKKSGSIIASHIPFIDNDYANCAVIEGNNLYVGCTDHVAVFSLPDLTLKKEIYIPNNEEHDMILNIVFAHNKLYTTYEMDFSTDGKGRIDVIDTNTNEWIKAIDLPEGGAVCINYSKSLDRIFTPSYTGGRIYKIDPNSDTIIDTINTVENGAFTVIHIKDEN